MDNDKLQGLKRDLNELKMLYSILGKSKQREKSDREEELKRMADDIIATYDLTKFDMGIKEERHKTKFFVSDVERIISAIEKDSDESQNKIN